MTSNNSQSKVALSETTSQAIESARSELVEVALDIHAHPELNYEEQHAVRDLGETRIRGGTGCWWR